MPRIALLCAMLLAPALTAQDTEPLTGSVPAQRRLTYLYRLDFGPGAVNYSLACNLMTPSVAGLIVRLIDIDLLAGSGALAPPGVDEHVLGGVGTANVSLSGMYSGAHEFAVEVESPGAGSTFTGSLTVNLGLIDFVSSDQLVLTASGFRSTVARRGFWDGSLFGGQTVASSFQLDMGPVSRTIFFRFEATGSNIEDIQLIDTSNAGSTILATFNSGLPDATAVPLTGSGIKTLRVNVRGMPAVAAGASWAATAPSEVPLSFVNDLGTSNGEDNDDGCAVAAGSGLRLVTLMPLLLLRRRHGMRKRLPIW